MTEQPDAVAVPTQQIDVPNEIDYITTPSTGALQRMEAEARALTTAFKIAASLSKTQMVPEIYQQNYTGTQSKPHPPLGERAAWNLAAAIMYGSELGLSAVQSAQNVFIVKGKPAVYARTMAAVVRRAGYVIEEVEASDSKVVWKAERDGTWAFSEWSIERATTAGYTTNDLYRKNPQEMLRAKCIAEVCRIKYQDVITGLAYSVEELQLQEVTVQRVTKQGVRGTARLREIAVGEPVEVHDHAVGEETHDDDGNQVTPAEVPQEWATNAQLAEIRKQYKARGVVGPAILNEVSSYLGTNETLTTLNNLTFQQAGELLDELRKPINPE